MIQPRASRTLFHLRHTEGSENQLEKIMSVKNRFTKALTAPTKERPVLDVVTSSAEVVADILMKDELFAAVPVFSTAFKAMKAMDSTRDRIFTAKLLSFVSVVETMTPDVRAEIAKKLTADNEGRKAGETLLLVLDKLTDMDKPALLGSLLKHYGYGRVTSSELRRLATAVDVAFADDLAEFLDESPEGLTRKSGARHREALLPTGLIRLYSGPTIGAIGVLDFGPTPLGTKLHELVHLAD